MICRLSVANPHVSIETAETIAADGKCQITIYTKEKEENLSLSGCRSARDIYSSLLAKVANLTNDKSALLSETSD